SLCSLPSSPTHPTPPLSLHDALPISPPTPHGGKVDDPRQRTPQPRRPSTADPTLPYPTDRTGRSRDGHLSRVRVEVGESMATTRSEEHTSELQSRFDLVCRLLLEQQK